MHKQMTVVLRGDSRSLGRVLSSAGARGDLAGTAMGYDPIYADQLAEYLTACGVIAVTMPATRDSDISRLASALDQAREPKATTCTRCCCRCRPCP